MNHNNTGIIITLGYPDTIVPLPEEWFSPYLKYLGVGNKTSVRAGHAALVLINKESGFLEYHDFGRYNTPKPNGRVRGRKTDNELEIPIIAQVHNDKIDNLDTILKFLATHPKLTHGDGRMVASICSKIDYNKASQYIAAMHNKHFIRYAAFIKEATNCARFVTDALIASVNSDTIKQKLIKSKWFTPSTVGNVILANTENHPFEVSPDGIISEYKGTQKSENLSCFLDRLKGYSPNLIGTLKPKEVQGINKKAQWMPGLGAGAWYELHKTENTAEFRYKRISPYGNVDCDSIYEIQDSGFNIEEAYKFVDYCNCLFFNIEQNGIVYTFNSKQKAHLI